MARPIHLFVSCSPNLAVEREIIGQVVATLPISVGWEVGYTPMSGENSNLGIESIAQCDVFLTLLGHDFAAPMGSEWSEALRCNIKPVAYRKNATHSPSAQMHLRESRVPWQDFQTSEELRGMLTPRLARMLLDRGERFGLHLSEVEGLLALLQSSDGALSEEESRTGAGHGGIILGRGSL
jgi:hypothetical protein